MSTLGDRMGFFAVIVASTLVACASDAPPTISVTCGALESFQGPELQGINFQGMSPNGMHPNGMHANGMHANGLFPNGVSGQGVSFQGLNLQGMSSQGLSFQGLEPQGLNGQGITAQGIGTQGLQPQGFTTQGVGAQGWSAQGTNVQGTSEDAVPSPNGLGAFALSGVTEEQANAWLAGTGSDVHASNLVRLRLEAGILHGQNQAGSILDEAELTGALLPFYSGAGDVLWIRLTSIEVHPTVSDLRLYTLEWQGENLCGDGGSGLFVPGIWDETGARSDSLAESTGSGSIDTTFSCTTGVIAKCVVWGYRPWSEGVTIHEACTRMARADYCGDGVPHTQNGTLIDMFDQRGIQEAVADDGMSFEAGWGPNGAVCVREPRYIDLTATGEVTYPSCWADKPRCDTWQEAGDAGAMLGNNSFHTLRQEKACP